MSNGYRTLSQHLNDLKKENFSLKLRIYFLEERMQQKYEASREDIYKRVSAGGAAGSPTRRRGGGRAAEQGALPRGRCVPGQATRLHRERPWTSLFHPFVWVCSVLLCYERELGEVRAWNSPGRAGQSRRLGGWCRTSGPPGRPDAD